MDRLASMPVSNAEAIGGVAVVRLRRPWAHSGFADEYWTIQNKTANSYVIEIAI